MQADQLEELRWKIPPERRRRIQMVLPRENMTQAEEKALLARFAKAAGAGEMLNIHGSQGGPRKGHRARNQQQHGL
jgi:hypothetical protein